MTIRSKGGLSFDELEHIERQLLARGFRQADDGAWEMRRYEYSTSRDEETQSVAAPRQGYSICWRN